MLIPWLLGGGWWKTTDLPDEQSLGAGYKDNDGFYSSRAGPRKIDEQDAATKINPEHGSLDVADFCALARLMQGWG